MRDGVLEFFRKFDRTRGIREVRGHEILRATFLRTSSDDLISWMQWNQCHLKETWWLRGVADTFKEKVIEKWTVPFAINISADMKQQFMKRISTQTFCYVFTSFMRINWTFVLIPSENVITTKGPIYTYEYEKCIGKLLWFSVIPISRYFRNVIVGLS